MELTLWAAIYFVYSVAIHSLVTVFRDLEEEEISHWLTAYWEAECGEIHPTWASDTTRFWKTDDSNLLMNFYYRGLPYQLSKAFGLETNLRETLQKRQTSWMLSTVEDVTNISQANLALISEEQFDLKRGHRLYAFPILFALQLLPHADRKTGDALSWKVGQLLKDTQENRGPYTESARDQINQIIAQILTEQLRVGRISWNSMVVTRDVLDPLIDLGTNPEKVIRFETALALSLQFLVYYRVSLESPEKRKRHSALCCEQAALIDNYFRNILLGQLAVDPSLIAWLEALQEHTKDAVKAGTPTTLVRQSSAAIMSRHSGAQYIPEKIWHLSVLNNLRAAHHSLGLPDCEDRRERVMRFLSENGVTRVDGISIIEKYIPMDKKDFRDDMMEFVKYLPDEDRGMQVIKPELFSLAPEVTLDELWAELSFYRTWEKWKDITVLVSLPAKPLQDLVIKTITPLIRRGLERYQRKRVWDRSRIDRLRSLVMQVTNRDVFQKNDRNGTSGE